MNLHVSTDGYRSPFGRRWRKSSFAGSERGYRTRGHLQPSPHLRAFNRFFRGRLFGLVNSVGLDCGGLRALLLQGTGGRPGMGSSPLRSPRRAFTLVELLVVIGIIAVLVGILLPVLANARKSAMDMQCQSNIRQLCSAMIMYANEFKGRYPPNIGTGGANVQWWYDADRIGRYLPKTKQFGTTSIYGTVFICPRDEEGGRSYAMNYYASSAPVTPQLATMDWAQYWTAASKPA